MGILSSMYTGITGLQGQGEALSIYGDNIANANTVGFKVSRPEFQDVVAKSLKGLLGGNQIGRGTRLAAVNPVFTQGSVLQTESPTDLSIKGDGFFVLEGSDGRTFTRNGAFHFDAEGYLINSDGFRVQGFQADESGKITSKMGPMSVKRTVIPAQATDTLKLFMNLDLREVAEEKVFDVNRADQTSHFATGATIYDTAGTPHIVTVYFNKTGRGQWQYRVVAKGEEVEGGAPKTLSVQATGKLIFDEEGRLNEHVAEDEAYEFKGAKKDQTIKLNFGTPRSQGGEGLEVTNYGTASEAYKTVQNGYTAGTLAGLSFSNEGHLIAIYTNGESVNLSQVAMGKFENPEGMFKIGQNRFRESRLSGQATIGGPGTGGRGTVSPKTIESSTTDIANEFINLMTAQRNFQASSRVIKVADQMMQEVLSLKQ